jgi:hypothetical protein
MTVSSGCESSDMSSQNKNIITQEVKKILAEGIYHQFELTDGRKVLDLIPKEVFGGGEGTRYLLTPSRGRDVIMTALEEKPSNEGLLLDEGRYIMRYHCTPEDGLNPDIHHELNLYPKSSERFYKLQYMSRPKRGPREYYCYPGPASPRYVI